MNDAKEDLIVRDREIQGGTPVFAGTRVPVHLLFDYLEQGSLDEFLDEFPSVSREQALEVLQLAKTSLLAYGR